MIFVIGVGFVIVFAMLAGLEMTRRGRASDFVNVIGAIGFAMMALSALIKLWRIMP